jgi:hypothetical protein
MTVHLRTLPFLLIAVTLSGCQSFTGDWSVGKSWHQLWNPEPKEKKSLYQTPARVVALWAPAMYNSPGKLATRGFGGRLYFYNQKDEPIAIEGQLVVYAFNDSAETNRGRQADRKFVFTSEQLSTHLSKTDLGASYSIWIPWDGVGGPQLEISLLPVFTASSGQVVMAEQSKNLLPGTTTPAANAQQQQGVIQPVIIDHRIAPASYASPTDLGQQPVAGQTSYYTHATPAPTQENIRTTSIQITPGLAERLIQERLQRSSAESNGFAPGNTGAPTNAAPPTTTYPIPAGALPPHMTQSMPGNSTFNVPTAGSRAWGPTLPRMNPPQGNRPVGNAPAGLVPGATTPVGQSPTRYAPGSLPAPVKANLPPASGPQPTQPGPAAQAFAPPS